MNCSAAKRWALALIGLSFLALAASVVLRVGIGHTPYETTDSQGRPMGFNDRLFAEHYRIILAHFSFGALFHWEHLYEWFLLGMQLTGAKLVLSLDYDSRWKARWFFFSQALFFPGGWLGIPMLPLVVRDIAFHRMDREGFVDVPFMWITAQPIWILSSLFICLVLLRGKWIASNSAPEFSAPIHRSG